MATSSQSYNASVSPGSMPASPSTTTQLTVTIRNCPGSSPYTPCTTKSNAALGSARVSFSGLTLVSVDALATPSGRVWNTPVVSGTTVGLSAKTGTHEANKLSPGQALTLKVSVRACALGSYPVGTSAFYNRDFTNGPLSSYSFKLSPSGSGPTVSVVPGALDGFTMAAIGSPQTAGDDFDVVATARDACGNAKTNYGGGAVVTGTLTPSSKPSPSGTAPIYGAFSNADWADGTATAKVTAFRAETGRAVTVSDGVSEESNAFDVQPGPLASLSFAQQPADTRAADTIAPAVAVEGTDAYGNAVSGPDVALSIGTNPSGGTLAGTTPQPLAAGIATFADLEVDTAGLGYTLVASSGSVSGESDPFDVVSETCTTNGVHCTASTSTGPPTESTTTVGSVTVLDTGSGAVGDGTIFVALDSPDACPGLPGSPVGSSFMFVPNGFDGAFVKLAVTYDRSITPKFSWKYRFCMDKEGTPAAPDYPNVPLCLVAALGHSDSPLLDALSWIFNYGAWQAALDAYVTANGPCILRRGRTSAGDLQVQFYMTADDPRVTGFG